MTMAPAAAKAAAILAGFRGLFLAEFIIGRTPLGCGLPVRDGPARITNGGSAGPRGHGGAVACSSSARPVRCSGGSGHCSTQWYACGSDPVLVVPLVHVDRGAPGPGGGGRSRSMNASSLLSRPTDR